MMTTNEEERDHDTQLANLIARIARIAIMEAETQVDSELKEEV